jgi:hypothetical protein
MGELEALTHSVTVEGHLLNVNQGTYANLLSAHQVLMRENAPPSLDWWSGKETIVLNAANIATYVYGVGSYLERCIRAEQRVADIIHRLSSSEELESFDVAAAVAEQIARDIPQ